MVNFGPLAAEIDLVVWNFGAPQLISMGFASSQRYWTAHQHWASAKLCGVEQRAPPIFGRAAITLGIGPHSISDIFCRSDRIPTCGRRADGRTLRSLSFCPSWRTRNEARLQQLPLVTEPRWLRRIDRWLV